MRSASRTCLRRSATPRSGRLDPRAAVGWDLEDVARRRPVFLHDIEGLIDPAFEVEGCYLLPNDEAERRIAVDRPPYVSEQNGRGPWAWDHHWLLVPLHDSAGEVIGVLWADEPSDRVLPSDDTLQALRVFANQAAAAVVASAHLNEVRFLADHDPLTRLLNRRAFVERLDGEVARATRYGHSFGLVLCDLDGFKELNDRFGHPAGDEALQVFARTLQSGLRKGDEAFRIGGDEFALLLAEASEGDAREVVRRIAEQSGGDPRKLRRRLLPRSRRRLAVALPPRRRRALRGEAERQRAPVRRLDRGDEPVLEQVRREPRRERLELRLGDPELARERR